MNKISLLKYIGKPYEEYNCLDLVKEFYLDHYNIVIQDYFEGPIPDPGGVEAIIISNKGKFIQTRNPNFGDIVVIKIHGLECHIGVVVNNGSFLHSTKKIGSNMDRLSRYSKLIAGYYRHRDRND